MFYIKMQVIWRYERFNLNLELEYKTCGGKCVFKHLNGTLFCFLIQNGFQFRNILHYHVVQTASFTSFT